MGRSVSCSCVCCPFFIVAHLRLSSDSEVVNRLREIHPAERRKLPLPISEYFLQRMNEAKEVSYRSAQIVQPAAVIIPYAEELSVYPSESVFINDGESIRKSPSHAQMVRRKRDELSLTCQVSIHRFNDDWCHSYNFIRLLTLDITRSTRILL